MSRFSTIYILVHGNFLEHEATSNVAICEARCESPEYHCVMYRKNKQQKHIRQATEYKDVTPREYIRETPTCLRCRQSSQQRRKRQLRVLEHHICKFSSSSLLLRRLVIIDDKMMLYTQLILYISFEI